MEQVWDMAEDIGNVAPRTPDKKAAGPAKDRRQV
jgi:hypothetical protein